MREDYVGNCTYLTATSVDDLLEPRWKLFNYYQFKTDVFIVQQVDRSVPILRSVYTSTGILREYLRRTNEAADLV